MWASITGNIIGWNPSVPAAGSTTGVIAASHPGRVYTGLTMGNNGANLLYAADFANGTIDVYNGSFALTTLSGTFADPTIPTTAGNTYHPYNIQNIGGSLYVTYAKVGVDGRAEDGVGNGFVRRFNTDGVRDLTFGINNGPLNAPWGTVIATPTFGIFGSSLLIGNFGEGNPSIHSFNPSTGAFLGTIQDESGNGIVIDELWALTFGNGVDGGSPGTMYFTAGVGEEEHGLFGSLTPTTASATSLVQFSDTEYEISEASNSIQITVTRNGNASGSASVRYATWDQSQPSHASQKSDYEINAGVVTFAPGETSQRFTIQLINDRFVEGNETIDLVLSNPVGTGVGLGSPNKSELRIIDNDVSPAFSNPIDYSPLFVRMQYLDLLRREPTAANINQWSAVIEACGASASCRNTKRSFVSSQFLLGSEFAGSVGLIFRMHRVAFGKDPLYGEVMFFANLQRALGVTTMGNWFATSPKFVAMFGALSNTAYVNLLATNSGFAFSTAKKNAWIAGLNGATLTRADVVRLMASDTEFAAVVRNRGIVLSGYWVYLRRDPDLSSFNLRLSHLNAAGGDPIASGLIGGFLTGAEYRQRFGAS